MFTSSFSPRFNELRLIVDVWNNSFDGWDNEHERERSLDIDIDDGRAVKEADDINFEIEDERRTGIFGVVDFI